MSGRRCAIGGDGQLFQGLIKLERRMGGPGAGKHRPAGGPRPPARLSAVRAQNIPLLRAEGRLVLFSNTKLLTMAQRFRDFIPKSDRGSDDNPSQGLIWKRL